MGGADLAGRAKMVASPQPKEADQVEHWKTRWIMRSQVSVCRLRAVRGALQAADPKKKST